MMTYKEWLKANETTAASRAIDGVRRHTYPPGYAAGAGATAGKDPFAWKTMEKVFGMKSSSGKKHKKKDPLRNLPK